MRRRPESLTADADGIEHVLEHVRNGSEDLDSRVELLTERRSIACFLTALGEPTDLGPVVF